MSLAHPKILLIEDEPSQVELIHYNLKAEGYEVLVALDGEEGLELALEEIPDLILLDWMLPKVSGIEVCRQLRRSKITREIPIIMLTARGEVSDRVIGLELGADDYLPKPFEPEELTARIQSIVRRIKNPESMIDQINFEHLKIDKLKQEVLLNGAPLMLSTTEFEALLIFAENCGQVLDRDFLVENLRGISWQSYDRSIDVLVSRLRNKLNALDPDTEYIKTIHGVGYKFIDRIKNN